MPRKTIGLAITAGIGAWLSIEAAAAQEYCVACTEPNAVYRCVIEGAQPGGSQPLQTMCVNALAKAGGHASCGLRKGTVFDCNGPTKRVPWTASAGETPTPIATPKPNAVPTDPKEPPKTMLELTDRANKKTAEEMKKAGETVKDGAETMGESLGRATKKTLDCVASLFSKC